MVQGYFAKTVACEDLARWSVVFCASDYDLERCDNAPPHNFEAARPQGPFVENESLDQLYSAKTDDELLVLLADNASLREEAKSVLADELRRRNLLAVPARSERRSSCAGTLASKSLFVRMNIFCGILILNIFVELLGTELLVTEIGAMFHPQSIADVLWKTWSLNLLGAASIGFFMWRTWKTEATKWTWVLSALWFGLSFVTFKGNGGIWSHFSGADCVGGVRSSGCTDFFAFTVPLVRGVAYSIGAGFSSMLTRLKPQSQVEVVDRDSPLS